MCGAGGAFCFLFLFSSTPDMVNEVLEYKNCKKKIKIKNKQREMPQNKDENIARFIYLDKSMA